MQPISRLTLLALVLVGGRAVIDSAKPDTCTSEYEGYTVNIHTMCLTDRPDAAQVTLTQADKDAVVTRHNDIRANVTPTAANMQKMVWDEDLAKVAAKWAMQCAVAHDKNRSVPELKAYGSWVGQNAAGGYRSVVHASNGWFSEVKDWIFGKWTMSTGHYIQEIWHSSSRVGCGEARCENSKYRTYLVCNYFPGTGVGYPFEQGAPCSKCPDHCDASGKLCDCGGLVCANGGKLNVSTCGCECKPLWTGRDCTAERCLGVVCQNHGTVNLGTCKCDCTPGFTGDLCETCPRKDVVYWCNYGTFHPEDKCPNGTDNWHSRQCPLRCGVCPDPCPDTVCEHQGKADPDTCKCICNPGFKGDRCEICPKRDIGMCSWKQFIPEKKCPSGSNNWNTKHCPIRCGICPEPCPDTVCQHRGTVNPDNCTCVCQPGFTGQQCEICPKRNVGWCSLKTFIPEEKCPKGSNNWNTRHCPIRCGICPEPCPDTVCQHHGTVNPDNCTCVCQPGFTGQQCETCPTKDNAGWCTYAAFKPDESCPNKTNNWYSKQCPVRCGMC